MNTFLKYNNQHKSSMNFQENEHQLLETKMNQN